MSSSWSGGWDQDDEEELNEPSLEVEQNSSIDYYYCSSHFVIRIHIYLSAIFIIYYCLCMYRILNIPKSKIV